MKIYSEVLKKFYDDEKSCLKAEKEYSEQQAKAEQEKRDKVAMISKEMKELAAAVEAADAVLSAASEEYELANEQVNKIYEKAREEAEAILRPAKEKLKIAQQERYKTISAFNKRFGEYVVRYTGDRAYQELKRATSWIDGIFNNWF